MIEEFNLEKNGIVQLVIELSKSSDKVKSIAVENPSLFISKKSFTHGLKLP